PTVLTLVRRVRETALAAYTHQDVPFERVVEELAPARDLSHAPLFQVMLALQNAPEAVPSLGTLSVESMGPEDGAAKVDLTPSLVESGREIEGVLEYARDLFDDATAEAMAGRLVRLYEAIAAAPASRVSDLPLLTAEERTRLARWSEAPAA